MAALIGFLLIVLQPFDTYASDMEHKIPKLLGYSLVSLLAYLCVYPMELALFKFLRKWTRWTELVTLISAGLTLSIGTYFYHHIMFSGPKTSLLNYLQFITSFSWGFIILLVPVIAYVRLQFGRKVLKTKQSKNDEIRIWNSSKSESIAVGRDELAYIEAQQNYVCIHYKDEQGSLSKKMLRNTISAIKKDLAFMVQIHRSYLINISFAGELKGTKRKATIMIANANVELPVSHQYHDEVRSSLQNRP
ncbi:MAG: LytTR family transcriptional regulator DNA-binding domain-containing protein [Ekhidna sp.]|nr:LytTR family transcriptional regulator DNA-binding domain-containing protein [Ekhidna sp.]